MKGIAKKLIVLLIAITAGVLAILGVMDYHAGQMSIDRELRHSLSTIGNRLIISLRQSVYEFDTGTARDTVLGEFPNPDVAAILVWTQDRQRLLSGIARKNGGVQDILQEPEGNQLLSERRNIVVESGIKSKPETIGEVQIFLDRYFQETQLKRILLRHLSKITLTVILLLAILSFVINHYLVRPLETFWQNMQATEQAALEYADADYRESFPPLLATKVISRGFSELQYMGEIFNKMIKAIRYREHARYESERNYREIFNSTGDAIFIHSANTGEILDVNQTMLNMYGYKLEETLKLKVSDLSSSEPPYTEEEAIIKLRKAVEQGPQLFEWLARKKNGEKFWVEVALKSSEIGGKDRVLAVVRDITDRKQSEIEIKESEYRYHTLFESANDAIFIMKDDLFIDCNQKTLYIFGCTREQIIKQPPYRFSPPLQPDGRESREVALEKIEAAYAGKPQFFEWKHQKYNGSLFDAEVSLNSIELGSERYLLALVRDITERKQAEKELSRHRDHLEDLVESRTAELAISKERAEIADHLKSVFLATMSHELRTPLNSIIGFTGIVLMGLSGPLNSEQEKQLGMVKSSARHLLNLINDVLDISKIEAGQLTIDTKIFNMNEVIENVIKIMTPMAEKKELMLVSNTSEELGQINSDHRRVEQILINLTNNAIKFTEKGQVSIECKISDEIFIADIKDTGIGIKSENMDKLFRPFQQIETGIDRRHEGTGLGLSICQKLAEMLGGTLKVESQWNVGSTFTLTLPITFKETINGH